MRVNKFCVGGEGNIARLGRDTTLYRYALLLVGSLWSPTAVAGPADSVLYRPRPALHCVRFVYAALLERKKVSTLKSDDAVTCKIYQADVWSKVITKIVRAEEGRG